MRAPRTSIGEGSSRREFIGAETLTAAGKLPGPSAEVRAVLLTGATGFLGRYRALEWREQLSLVDDRPI